jgi:transcriptional regulator with XRE-family HTH domain
MEARDFVIALKEKGMTQTQISIETGIAQSTISKIEGGNVKDVMSKSFKALQTLYSKKSKQPRKPRTPAQPEVA